jgi:hypothetical protein
MESMVRDSADEEALGWSIDMVVAMLRFDMSGCMVAGVWHWSGSGDARPAYKWSLPSVSMKLETGVRWSTPCPDDWFMSLEVPQWHMGWNSVPEMLRKLAGSSMHLQKDSGRDRLDCSDGEYGSLEFGSDVRRGLAPPPVESGGVMAGVLRPAAAAAAASFWACLLDSTRASSFSSRLLILFR